MKTLKKTLLAGLCAFAALTGCNKTESGPEASMELMYVPTVVSFKSEETKTYLVQSQNVQKIDVTAPAGWTASCTQELLSISAPKQGTEGIAAEGTVCITYSGTAGGAKTIEVPVALAIDKRPVLSFEVSVSDVKISSAKITCIPSSKDISYFCNVITAETYEKYQGKVEQFCADQLAYYQNRYDTLPLSQIIEAMTDKGDISGDTAKNLPAATDLYLFAITADETTGEAYGDPAFVQFSTLPPGKPEDCVLSFEINTLRSNYVQCDVLSTDSSIGYWFYYEEARNWTSDDDIAARVKKDMQDAADIYNMTFSDVVSTMTNYGDISDQFTDLEPGTDYILYAFAMDDAGNKVGPMFKKAFTTLLTDISDADITMECRYFDCDAVAAAKPEEYGKYAGQNLYLVQIKSTKNPYTYFWVISLMRGDATDLTKYPDTQTYAAMMSEGMGKYGLEITEYRVPKTDTQCTAFGFALDTAGSYGPLHRTLLNLSAQGVSSVSDMFVSTGGDATPIGTGAGRPDTGNSVAEYMASRLGGALCPAPQAFRSIGLE